MFFPKLSPSSIVGQSLELAAVFLGVAMVAIDGAVFSGPLLRDGNRVFMLYAEQQPDGQTTELRCVDIGDRATCKVLDHKQHIDFLTRRINDDIQTILQLRTDLETAYKALKAAEAATSDIRAEALESAKRATDHNQSLVDGHEAYRKDAEGRIAELTVANALNVHTIETYKTSLETLQEVHDESRRVHAAELYAMAIRLEANERDLARYIEAVGPLDPAPNVNDDIAAQLRLMEPEDEPQTGLPSISEIQAEQAEAVEPPSIVSGDITEARATIDRIATDIHPVIAREGSVVDHAFRRLMYLTRGDL